MCSYVQRGLTEILQTFFNDSRFRITRWLFMIESGDALRMGIARMASLSFLQYSKIHAKVKSEKISFRLYH
jgi:hypothetical protein